MNDVIYIASASAVISGLLVFFILHVRHKKINVALMEDRQDAMTAHAVGQEKITMLEQQLASLLEINQRLERQRDDLQSAYSGLQQRMGELKGLDDEVRALRAEKEGLLREMQSLRTKNTELETRQEEKELHFSQQMKQLDEQKELLKAEFEQLSNKIFENKGRVLSEQHKASLEGVLSPFRQQVQEFRLKVEDIHHKDTQQQVQLRTELQQLQALNKQMTEEAHQLAVALKGQKKMQGNWGEMVLENVLDRSGLQLGKDFDREVSFSTEEGRRRPDVIVYLPEKKHLIIDAKVSLNAYTRYVNAESEPERVQALKDHVSAISERINELADRSYYELPGLNSPEMVFMFIPIESAFVEALKTDEALFQKALEKNVLVATPTTLLTSLNIVRQLWRFEDQNRHTAELAEKAGKVYDKLNGFVVSMEALGKSLDKAKDSYERAYGQLYSGRGNLIKQANEFKQLGVAVKSEISQRLAEKAELELKHFDAD